MVDIRTLNTFLQVSSTLNITQASKILGYSQSNVSIQIQNLESYLGYPLFDRVGRNISLTQYGVALIPYAQQVIHAVKQLESFTHAENLLTGTIRVGFVESIFHSCFREIVFDYNERFPKVKIEVAVDATSVLQKLLLKNQIDVACLIDSPLQKGKLVTKYSKPVSMDFVVGCQNPLFHRNGLSLSDLCREKFILMEDTAPYNILFYQELARQNLNIQEFLKMQSCHMALQLVESSNYITLLPRYVVKNSMKCGKAAALNIVDCKLYQEVQIMYCTTKYITPQISGFIDCVSSVLDRID